MDWYLFCVLLSFFFMESFVLVKKKKKNGFTRKGRGRTEWKSRLGLLRPQRRYVAVIPVIWNLPAIAVRCRCGHCRIRNIAAASSDAVRNLEHWSWGKKFGSIVDHLFSIIPSTSCHRQVEDRHHHGAVDRAMPCAASTTSLTSSTSTSS